MPSFKLNQHVLLFEKLILNQLTKEIPSLRETEGSSPFYIRTQKDTALNQVNPVHILTIYSSRTNNNILPSTPRSLKWSLPFNFFDDQNFCVYFLYSPYVLFWHHSRSATVGAFSPDSATTCVNTHLIQF